MHSRSSSSFFICHHRCAMVHGRALQLCGCLGWFDDRTYEFSRVLAHYVIWWHLMTSCNRMSTCFVGVPLLVDDEVKHPSLLHEVKKQDILQSAALGLSGAAKKTAFIVHGQRRGRDHMAMLTLHRKKVIEQTSRSSPSSKTRARS